MQEKAITLVEAINHALAYELKHDHNVVLMGEDVGINGGVFRATVGLKEQFPNRVLDTPLAEGMLAGLAVGMSAQSLKPIIEMQFMGFSYPAYDHLINHLSRMRNRTRGRLSCPMVLRAPYGGGIHAPEHHSESTEAIYAHIPGIRVVIPGSPARAYGLLLAAIRNPDPVVFLEPKRIYRKGKQVIQNNGQALPLDQCFILEQGSDITLISWGAMLEETLACAQQLKAQNIHADVIDVATIKPLDIETMVQSVKKTGRCVIIHEAARTCGVGAEITAQLNEKAFAALKAPIARVTGYDTIMPLYKLEKEYLPTVSRILTAVHDVLDY